VRLHDQRPIPLQCNSNRVKYRCPKLMNSAFLHPPRKCFSALFVLTVSFFLFNIAVGAFAQGEQPSARISRARWVLPVMFPEQASQPHRNTADRLSKLLGIEHATSSKTNPVCCFWVEIDGWAPNPGSAGFTIVLQKGGAIIRATNQEQLDRAILQVQAVREIRDGEFYLPTDLLLTSYPTLPSNSNSK
jgi:hypothetical protein